PRARTRVFAWAQALWSLALVVGSLSAGVPTWLRALDPGINDLDAHRPPFIALIVLAAIATLLVVRLAPSPGAVPGAGGVIAGSGAGWLPARSAGMIARYALALGLFGLGLGVAVQLLPLWFALRFGADEVALGPWYAAGQVLSLSSVALSPWLDRRLGGALAVLLVQVLGGACLLAIALVAPIFEIAAAAS